MTKINNKLETEKILKDAMKVDELVNQLQEVDHECDFHNGSFKGMLDYYTKDIIIDEAKNRLDMANENLDDWGMYEGDEDYKRYMRDKRQLERFLNKRREVKDLFDEKFVKMFEFYMCSCMAAFRFRDLVVFQLQIVKNFQSAHRTRDYIYS